MCCVYRESKVNDKHVLYITVQNSKARQRLQFVTFPALESQGT